MTRAVQHVTALLCLLGAIGIVAPSPAASTRRFLDDDPISREPETQDASSVQSWDIDLFVDLTLNLFGRPGDADSNVRAKNVNTIDEVPDSSWFTNRIGTRPVTIDEVVRGPLTGNGPAPGPWVVIAPKNQGFAPGFTIRDALGEMWFVSFDAAGYPEAATGAILVANKIFWSLGYWQVENHLVSVVPDTIAIGESAVFTPLSGKKRPMRRSDLDGVFERAHRSPDGSYRAVAGRAVPGRPVGGFRYHGTRPDDPNDIFPHEHRRELRALKVFGAWTNLVDMKAGNTLDSVIADGDRSIVRHYLQDVGSTFGSGANGPREYDEGWEFLYDGELARKRLVRLGFFIQPWQTLDYVDNDAVGRFEGDAFDPLMWRPRVPTAAFLRARADDCFWAARRVAAFSDESIRAIAATARYSDSQATALLADVLIRRRNKIAAGYLGAVNPLVDFALSADGRLSFRNAAVDAGVVQSPEQGYRASWASFDNNTGESIVIGSPARSDSTELSAPGPLPSTENAFLKVEVASLGPSSGTGSPPVSVFFRRTRDGWRLVGLERQP
jgi:hypothetical protein